MKKIIISALLVLVAAASLQAQVAPKYKQIKNDYNSRDWVKQATDPYKPGWSAFASFVIPGLGQALSGEVGRGLAFFAGSTALSAVGSYGANKMVNSFSRDENGKLIKDSDGKAIVTDEAGAKQGFGIMMGAGLAEVVVCIWSCCDASRVAKVKNLYYQDQMGRRSEINVDMQPYFSMAPVSCSSSSPTAGLSLRMSF